MCVHEHFETKILPGVFYKVSPDSLDVTVLTIRTILCLVHLTGIEPVCGVAVPFHPQYPIQRINKSRACRLNYNLPVSRRTPELGVRYGIRTRILRSLAPCHDTLTFRPNAHKFGG
jgi:hypothetical protein